MGYPACLYNPVSYPNRAATRPAFITQHRKESEKLAGKSRGTSAANSAVRYTNAHVNAAVPQPTDIDVNLGVVNFLKFGF
jgi:hypothetical protein